ncbi:E3 ubiquitin-protein ligase RNF115-like [Homarus americanus]|uniref:E3 ubiquitin-protein ligase RNF115-like n=1 Tax=Homarus americanus TaxID=6706 RepID=A0A8J5N940_HOMAM|nr:E3 ubiquitin-protein ligase RNF115-like [Homarus americanus]
MEEKDYVCPRCNSGFIEELERARDSDSDSSSDTEMESYEMWDMITHDGSVPGVSSPAASSSGPGFPVLVASNLASNPGDYAWGRGGLDAIITQLMNQLDGTGPPPLSRDQISQIPTSNITKDQCELEEEAVVHEILSLGNSMGLEVDDDDVEELVEEHSKELSTEELLELHKEQNETLKQSLTSEESGG